MTRCGLCRREGWNLEILWYNVSMSKHGTTSCLLCKECYGKWRKEGYATKFLDGAELLYS